MFNFSDKAAIKIDDLLIFDINEIKDFILNNQILFKDLVLDYSKSGHTAYGYNAFGHLIKLSFLDGLLEKIVLLEEKAEAKQIKMLVSYDGSNFHGFQYQVNKRTVQGELSKIINEVNQNSELVQGASRTDAHVHALEQVIHFKTKLDIDVDKWMDILNHQLPKDIYVLSVREMHPLFHSRYDVYKKSYIYKIRLDQYDPLLANYVLFEKDLDLKIMEDNLQSIIGTHDFSSFSKIRVDDPIRTIYRAKITQKDKQLEIEIEGNGFLRYMIRYIVDYLIKLGKHQATLSLKEVMELRNRSHTKSLASANGLYLKKIYY